MLWHVVACCGMLWHVVACCGMLLLLSLRSSLCSASPEVPLGLEPTLLVR